MQSSHLKLIAELYDKCQEVVTQYAEFLRHALSPQDYQQLLPSLQVGAAQQPYLRVAPLVWVCREGMRSSATAAAAAAAVAAAAVAAAQPAGGYGPAAA